MVLGTSVQTQMHGHTWRGVGAEVGFPGALRLSPGRPNPGALADQEVSQGLSRVGQAKAWVPLSLCEHWHPAVGDQLL